MAPTDRDYEFVGRWLDGEAVELTAEQKALAARIAADAAVVGEAMDVPLPAGMLHRVHRRRPSPAPRRGRWRSVWRWSAAAAVILLAAALAALLPGRGAHLADDEYVDRFLGTPADPLDAQVELLADELAAYHVELALAEESAIDLTVSGLEQEVGEMMEDPAPEEAEAWDLLEEPL